MNWVFVGVHMIVFKRRVPDWQWVKGRLDARAQMIGRLAVAMAFCGALEFAHRFHIKLKQIGLRAVIKAHVHGPVLIGRIPGFVIIRPVGNMFDKEAAIFNIAVKLIRVHIPAPGLRPIAAKPCQRPDAGFTDMVHDVIGIIVIFLAAVFIDKAR